MADKVCSSTSLADEMLYGRAGYLCSLLYLRREIGDSLTIQKTIKQVLYECLLFIKLCILNFVLHSMNIALFIRISTV